jgi:DNA-binding transcriptional ArsR family regulator
MTRKLWPLSDKMIETVARQFRVLGEPQRLRILQLLEAGPRTVNEVVEALGSSQPNVSRHLRGLFEAGLVARRREHTQTVYSIADPLVFRLCSLVCDNVIRQARTGLVEMESAPGRSAVGGHKR